MQIGLVARARSFTINEYGEYSPYWYYWAYSIIRVGTGEGFGKKLRGNEAST
jgi:hypothetical protein